MTDREFTVEPDLDAGAPGYAVIRVPGAAGLAMRDDLRLRVQRLDREHDRNLAPEGWQSAPADLKPWASEAEGDDLLVRVGPQVVDRIDGHVQVDLTVLPGPREGWSLWPDLPTSKVRSGAGPEGGPPPGDTPPPGFAPTRPDPPPPPEPEPAPVEPDGEDTVVLRAPPRSEPDPGPDKPEPEDVETARPRAGVAIGLLVAVLVVAGALGAGWYTDPFGWFGPDETGPVVAENGNGNTEEPVAAPPEGGEALPPPPLEPDPTETGATPENAASADAAPEPACEESFVYARWFVAQQTEAPAWLDRARGLAGEGCADAALLLFLEAADGGQPGALLDLGRLYDPRDPTGSAARLEATDAASALSYYDQAVAEGVEGAEADRDGLLEHLRGLAESGDTDAAALVQGR